MIYIGESLSCVLCLYWICGSCLFTHVIILSLLLVTYISHDRIVNKYQDNPWRMQLISNHFYSEKVFDDSTSDKPKLRWRHRNFFGDGASHNQGTHDDDDHVIDSQNDNHSYKNDLESKQVHVSIVNQPFFLVKIDIITLDRDFLELM